MFFGDDYGDYGAARTVRPAAGAPMGAGLGLDRRTSTWQERATAARQVAAGQAAPAMAPGDMPQPGLMQIAPPEQVQQGQAGATGAGSWLPWLAGAVALAAVAGGGYWWYTSRSSKKAKKDSE